MEGLRDIQGLGAIGIWPLAVGWWTIIVIALGIIIYLMLRLYKQRKFMRSWQGQAFKNLQTLEQSITHEQPKDILQQLAIEMRQIAMRTTDRSACAGLTGQQWLQWLEEHDPMSFTWSQHGVPIINAQYMPDSTAISTDQMRDLINAAKMWVNKC